MNSARGGILTTRALFLLSVQSLSFGEKGKRWKDIMSFHLFIPTPVGKTRIAFRSMMGILGSSPRLWGKHMRRLAADREHRFIPTPVGKTPPPRGGSAAAERFIPTPVGKTTRCPRSGNGRKVHPHACGENPNMTTASLVGSGSSPRLWGKHEARVLSPAGWRFIPTPVGKT